MSFARNFRMSRRYVGPVRGLILDWSGTTADKYVLAPAVVFVEVFKKHGVPISMKEARLPMGLRKDLHIAKIIEIPEVRDRWKEVKGVFPNQGDVDAMFKDFVPMQLAVLRQYAGLMPGVVETVNRIRQNHKLKIGHTTGFFRSMVDILLEEAKKQGYAPDVAVAGDDVIHGARPKPFMIYKNLDLLDIHPIQSVVKVDDTVGGVGEGLEAGCWSVGIAKYSNYMDIDTIEQADKMPPEEMQKRIDASRDKLAATGAHYVIDEFSELEGVLDDVNARLARGESPTD